MVGSFVIHTPGKINLLGAILSQQGLFLASACLSSIFISPFLKEAFQNTKGYNWDGFHEKGPSTYMIKFPVCEIKM